MGEYNTSAFGGKTVGYCLKCSDGIMVLNKVEGVIVCNSCFYQVMI